MSSLQKQHIARLKLVPHFILGHGVFFKKTQQISPMFYLYSYKKNKKDYNRSNQVSVQPSNKQELVQSASKWDAAYCRTMDLQHSVGPSFWKFMG